jgi:hypothetical protein
MRFVPPLAIPDLAWIESRDYLSADMILSHSKSEIGESPLPTEASAIGISNYVAVRSTLCFGVVAGVTQRHAEPMKIAA